MQDEELQRIATAYSRVSEILLSDLTLPQKIDWLEAFEWAENPCIRKNVENTVFTEALRHVQKGERNEK